MTEPSGQAEPSEAAAEPPAEPAEPPAEPAAPVKPAEPAAPVKRRRGPGRPRQDETVDGPGTQERIRLAAREVFAERGYDKTSVRGIAKVAGVDPALVHHYFGSKDDLFAAAIEVSMEPALVVPAIIGEGPEGIGERLARYFLGIWENPVSRAPCSP